MLKSLIARWKRRNIRKRARASLDEELRIIQEQHEDLLRQVERIKKKINFR